jgi:hypothetical protein
MNEKSIIEEELGRYGITSKDLRFRIRGYIRDSRPDDPTSCKLTLNGKLGGVPNFTKITLAREDYEKLKNESLYEEKLEGWVSDSLAAVNGQRANVVNSLFKRCNDLLGEGRNYKGVVKDNISKITESLNSLNKMSADHQINTAGLDTIANRMVQEYKVE